MLPLLFPQTSGCVCVYYGQLTLTYWERRVRLRFSEDVSRYVMVYTTSPVWMARLEKARMGQRLKRVAVRRERAWSRYVGARGDPRTEFSGNARGMDLA